MMDQQITCSKCGGMMQRGFILDKTDRGHWTAWGQQAEWFSGEPVRSILTGYVKLNDKDRRMVIDYCCDDCGFIETYALKP